MLRVSKLCVCVSKLCVCERVVCEGVVCVCERVVCERGVCVMVWEDTGREEEAGRTRTGVHNQKQEPRTKMWGKKENMQQKKACKPTSCGYIVLTSHDQEHRL